MPLCERSLAYEPSAQSFTMSLALVPSSARTSAASSAAWAAQ